MTPQLKQAFILVIVFQIKHFLGDFPLQSQYMLKKTRPGWDFIRPLGLHCLVHGGMTLTVCLFIAPQLWWLSGVDFLSHFVMDRIKAGPKYLGRFNDYDHPAFWNCFGFDQMVHHLTHLYVIWMLIQVPAAV